MGITNVRLSPVIVVLLGLAGCSVSQPQPAEVSRNTPNGRAVTVTEATGTAPSAGTATVFRSGTADTKPSVVATFVDGKRLDVRASGLDPERFYAVRQCTPDAKPGLIDAQYCDGRTTIKTDSSGKLSGQLPALGTIWYSGSREGVCAGKTDCVVAVSDVSQTILATSPVDLVSVKLPARPTVKLGKATYNPKLKAPTQKNKVRVTGEGFTPSKAVSFEQCPYSKDSSPGDEGRPIDADDCLVAYTQELQVNKDGTVDGFVHMYTEFQRSDGEIVDCKKPGYCALSTVLPKNGNRFFSAEFHASPGK